MRNRIMAEVKAAKSPTFPVPNTNLALLASLLAYEYDIAVIKKANACVLICNPSATKASDPNHIPQPISRIIDAVHKVMTSHVFLSLAE